MPTRRKFTFEFHVLGLGALLLCVLGLSGVFGAAFLLARLHSFTGEPTSVGFDDFAAGHVESGDWISFAPSIDSFRGPGRFGPNRPQYLVFANTGIDLCVFVDPDPRKDPTTSPSDDVFVGVVSRNWHFGDVAYVDGLIGDVDRCRPNCSVCYVVATRDGPEATRDTMTRYLLWGSVMIAASIILAGSSWTARPLKTAPNKRLNRSARSGG